jgi:hypothetical protein
MTAKRVMRSELRWARDCDNTLRFVKDTIQPCCCRTITRDDQTKILLMKKRSLLMLPAVSETLTPSGSKTLELEPRVFLHCYCPCCILQDRDVH